MDLLSTAMLISFIFGCCYYIITRRSSSKYPPGPYPLPILGNIHLLGRTPHRSLARLAKAYGPLMHLRFGIVDAIIVSNSDVCKELVHKYDHLSSGRPQLVVTRAFDHAKLSIIWLPPNDSWRRLRKICKEHLFSAPRLDATRGLRREKLRKLRVYLDKRSLGGGAVVDISEAMFLTTLNLMWDTLFSLDFAEYNTDSSREMFKVVTGLLNAWGLPNAADFFPILSRFDPQGIYKGAEIHTRKIFEIFDGIINRRLRTREGSSSDQIKREDMLESLLDMHQKNPSEFSLIDIKHLLLDLALGGSDTSSGLTTWAMTELLRNPNKLTKVKEELNNAVIISKNRSIEESDISNLPYLQAAIKETLRLHPPAPFVPRSNDLKINGHDIPKNSRILINIWAMGRDPSVWSDPDSFVPERFIEHEIDVKGHDFRFVPFGLGRRMCPGIPLGNRMTHLMLASFVRDFDWNLEPGLKPQDIDMSERFGLVLEKAVHLKAIPVKTGSEWE